MTHSYITHTHTHTHIKQANAGGPLADPALNGLTIEKCDDFDACITWFEARWGISVIITVISLNISDF